LDEDDKRASSRVDEAGRKGENDKKVKTVGFASD